MKPAESGYPAHATVGDWEYSGGRDHFYAFLRKDYPHFDDVAKLLIRTEPAAEEAATELASEDAKFTSVGLRSDGRPLKQTMGPEGRQSWRFATSGSGPVYYRRSAPISVIAGGNLETEVTVYFEEVENGYMNVGLYFLDREGKALGGAIVPSLHRPEAKWIIHSHSTPVPAGALSAYIQFQWKAREVGTPLSGVLYCESVRARQAD